MPKSLAAVRPAPLVPSPLPAADTEEKPPAAGREDTAVETGAANAVPGGEDAGSPLKREWRGRRGSTLRANPRAWGTSSKDERRGGREGGVTGGGGWARVL